MEEFGQNREWKAPSDRALAGLSIGFGFASWALFWLWFPQVIAVVCGVVVLRRKGTDERATTVTAVAGGGVLMGILALVLAVVLSTAPESFWDHND